MNFSSFHALTTKDFGIICKLYILYSIGQVSAFGDSYLSRLPGMFICIYFLRKDFLALDCYVSSWF